MPTLQLPLNLRKRVAHQEHLSISKSHLMDDLKELITTYPALKPYLLDDNKDRCHFVTFMERALDSIFLTGYLYFLR